MTSDEPRLASLQVVTLGAADYDAVCAIWAAAGLKYRPHGRDSRERFAEQQASGLQTVFGARQDDQLVGVAVITHDGRKGWINRIAVVPAARRQGVGLALIRAAERHLQALGLQVTAALIEHGNDASLALFRSAGYMVEPVHYVAKRDRPDV